MKEQHLVTVPYYDDLILLRYACERTIPEFPEDCCQEASRAVMLALGIEEIAGLYAGNTLYRWHAWNYDSQRGLYVDISRDHFTEAESHKITIVDESSMFYIHTKRATTFQRRGLKQLIDRTAEAIMSNYMELKKQSA